MSTMPPINTEPPAEEQLAAWEAQLWEKGYLVIPGALSPELTAYYRERIAGLPTTYGYRESSIARIFEQGIDLLLIAEHEPVFSLMQRILGEQMHLMSLQGHRMKKGTEVLGFHSDEIYLQRPAHVSDDVEYPPIINAINCHYYLVDVPEELGPTQIVPGSHNACRQPRKDTDGHPPTWKGQTALSMTCKAGDLILYSNHCWHSGAPNHTDRMRLSIVPTYARRFIAQRFWPFLNYTISRDILDQCTPRQRQLLGEHPRGAYGKSRSVMNTVSCPASLHIQHRWKIIWTRRAVMSYTNVECCAL